MADDTSVEIDEPTPDEIVSDVEAGAMDYEHGMIRLLAEIANGIYLLVAGMDELVEMAKSEDRVH